MTRTPYIPDRFDPYRMPPIPHAPRARWPIAVVIFGGLAIWALIGWLGALGVWWLA